MNCVILAAGFATRLYPITKSVPKPLLKVGVVTILDRLFAQLEKVDFKHIVLVSNTKFAQQFQAWCPDNVELLVNPADEPHNRLGAVADLEFGLECIGTKDSALVTAADNIYPSCLADMVASFTGQSLVGVWRNDDKLDQQRRGNVEIVQNTVVRFVEKPPSAVTNWAAAPLYCFSPHHLALVGQFLQEVAAHDLSVKDAPGHFLAWLVQRESVDAYALPDRPIDIGTPEALAQARKQFTGR